jgi:hypothetical protein
VTKLNLLAVLLILLSGCANGFAIGGITITRPAGAEFDLEIDGNSEIAVAIYQQPAKVVRPYVDQELYRNWMPILPPWTQRYYLDQGDILHVNVAKSITSGPIEIKLALGSQIFKKITLPEGQNDYSFEYAPWK